MCIIEARGSLCAVCVGLCVIKHWIKLCPIQKLNAYTKEVKIRLKVTVYFHIFLCTLFMFIVDYTLGQQRALHIQAVNIGRYFLIE